MANFSNTEYIDAEISLVLSKASEILNDKKQWWVKWTILETTESSISAREGLLGFLFGWPITMTIRASTVLPGESHPPKPHVDTSRAHPMIHAAVEEERRTPPSVGSTRVDSDLSCWGLGPIIKNRLKRIEDKIIGKIMLSIWADDPSL